MRALALEALGAGAPIACCSVVGWVDEDWEDEELDDALGNLRLDAAASIAQRQSKV